MRTIWLVTVTTPDGEEMYYAGAENGPMAMLMANRAGFDSDAVEVKMIPNRHGIQASEWKKA